MEVPLPVILVHHPGLLQEVTEDVATHRGALWVGQDVATAQGDWGQSPASPSSPALRIPALPMAQASRPLWPVSSSEK